LHDLHRGFCLGLAGGLLLIAGGVAAAEPSWKVGTAKAVITPKQAIWMAGYGSRTRPADGTLHDLYVRALALEDGRGHRGLVIAADLVGVPRSVSEDVCGEIERRFGIPRARIMLNTSHTHCGPVLSGALTDIYPLDDAQQRLIQSYTAGLAATFVRTAGEALSNMSPATLWAGQGSADFAVNRRNNREPDVPTLREQGALRGPTDHAVPVLAARSADGKLLAVAFGYACHNTTLDIQKWNGDYAGFAQSNLEQAHAGALALFHMGCGADQNPLPRRTIELGRQYGRGMTEAVEAVLKRPMKKLSPILEARYERIPLDLGPAPTRQELTGLAKRPDGYVARWATRLLAELDGGRAFQRSYPYPIQVWRLGASQWWIALGGEVVVDYSLRIKAEHGGDTWVTSYSNDVMAYIPSRRVLDEGGYEGATSMMVYGLPAHRWADDVEERIVAAVNRLMKDLSPQP
jgi:hypothetical protein